MQTWTKFFVIFVTIFTMVATANAQQSFAPNEKGEVSAMTADVRALMERADKIILETVRTRLEADEKVIEAMSELKKIIANESAKTLEISTARINLLGAIGDTFSVRRPASVATHRAAMLYFDNVNSIVKAGFKLAKDGYSEWQKKTLSDTKFAVPPQYKNLMAESDKAMEAAKKMETESFRQFQADFEEMQKRDKELRERISK